MSALRRWLKPDPADLPQFEPQPERDLDANKAFFDAMGARGR